MTETLAAPLRQMASNAGMSPDVTEKMVRGALGAQEAVLGVDFTTGEMVDMSAAGIIDPVRVTITALRNAVSVSSSLVTTNYAIIEEKGFVPN